MLLRRLASCAFNIADIFGMGSLPEQGFVVVCCLASTWGMDVRGKKYLVVVCLVG